MASAEPGSDTAAPDLSSQHAAAGHGTPVLVVGALGVVYGDIGTSPIYAFREALHAATGGDIAARGDVLGVLSLIAENPGRKQSEIAAALGIQRANFVVLMNELESRHLTERRSVPHDRRSYAIYLTPAGESLLCEARRAEANFEADCLERLGGPRSRDQFLQLLRRLFG